MKNIALLAGITQGILSLSVSGLASEASDSLFALSKISGPGRMSVARLSDSELARVKGGVVPTVIPLTLVPAESVLQHFVSQSNVAQQSNSATVSQEGGNSSTISQENSRTQTNSGTSGNNQSTQSNNTTVQQTPPGNTTVQQTPPGNTTVQQTPPGSNITVTQGNGASGHPGTVTIATEDNRTVIEVTSQGKSVTIVVPQSISVETLLSALPVHTLASVDFRVLQAVINNVSVPVWGNAAIGLQNR